MDKELRPWKKSDDITYPYRNIAVNVKAVNSHISSKLDYSDHYKITRPQWVK